MTDTSKIFVDIDSLFDLRQAVLFTIHNDPNELADFLLSEEYNFRARDNFSIVDNNLFKETYKNRTLDLLPASTITYILIALKSKLANLEKRNTFYNEKKFPEILLNVYPFNLSKEQIEYIQNLLYIKLETNTLVTIINIPPEEVTPYFIKNNGIITCFIYDFTSWMNKHMSALEKNKLTDTLIYFPAISSEELTAEVQTKITKLGFKDIFSYTEFLLSSVINLSFLPTVFYSNLITATSYLNKFNKDLKDKKLSSEEKIDVDLSALDIP